MVGRESTFPSGAADLILVDDRGQVCLVEVKKEGNPDVRRVVAQLLDYAAGLWGKTLLEFEQDVFLPYAEKAGGLPISLRVLRADKFGRRVDEGATDDTELQLRRGDRDGAWREPPQRSLRTCRCCSRDPRAR